MKANTRSAKEKEPSLIHKDSYDLAVIGAGPAGALTAALCAKEGLSTVLIEKKNLPRYKPCGGFISERALALLPENIKVPTEASLPIYDLEIVIGGRSYKHHSQDRLGILTTRADFDFCLAQYAIENGVKLVEGYMVQELQTERRGPKDETVCRIKSGSEALPPLYAHYIVGADGAAGRCAYYVGKTESRRPYSHSSRGHHQKDENSSVHFQGRPSCPRSSEGHHLMDENGFLHFQGRSNKVGLGLTGIHKIEEADSRDGLLTFYPLPAIGGMGWAFHGRGWINRGVGGLCGRRKLEKIYHTLFPESYDTLARKAWPLPFLGPLQNVGNGNLLLVGDAAGLVDPFSGEGLCNSFQSARLASISLLEAYQKNETPGTLYAGMYRKHFYRRFPGALLNAAYLHTRALANPAAMPRLFAGIMKHSHFS